MKGILAYRAFNGISDTFVEESLIPESVLLSIPARKDRETSVLRRFLNSGWGAACISMTVALAVLMGIIYAGHRDPGGPPVLNTPPAESETVTDPLTEMPTEMPTDAPTESPTQPEDTAPEGDPHIAAVLKLAEPMAPAVPEGAELVGETALYVYFSEHGSGSSRRVSRVAVYRDGDDAATHYLYADVLTDKGTVVATHTVSIRGFFALLLNRENEGRLVLATLEGRPSADGTLFTLSGLRERWISWDDADPMSGEDIGDVRLMRMDGDSWSQDRTAEYWRTGNARIAQRLWDPLSVVLRSEGGVDQFGVLVDFMTVADTPALYSREEAMGADAAAACALLLDDTHFETVWARFKSLLLSDSEVPPSEESTTSSEDTPDAPPMEADIPADAVFGGSTYATDTFTLKGEMITATTRMAVWRDADDPTAFYLYRDILGEDGAVIASETLPVSAPFGLAQNSLTGAFQLYTATATAQEGGTALFSLTVEDLIWSDLDPVTGETAETVIVRRTRREDLSWSYHVDMTPAAHTGIDRYWETNASRIVVPWLESTVTGWQRDMGEMGMEESGYLTFWIDTLLTCEELAGDPEALWVLHPESDEETRMGTYFMMNTGYEALQSWFRFTLQKLGYQP